MLIILLFLAGQVSGILFLAGQVIILLFLAGQVSGIVSNIENGYNVSKIRYYEKLRKDLLSRPVAVHKIPPAFLDGKNSSYNMSFQLWVADISDVDELNQVVTMNAYIDIRWTQTELSWNSSHYDDINMVLMNIDTIWSPLVLVVMGKKNSDILEFSKTVQLTSNGQVKSVRHSYLTFTCNINFLRYPFDSQVCNVGFLPAGMNTRHEIALTYMTNYPLSQYVSVSGEWYLENVSFETVTTRDMFDIALYSMTMSRQSTYYVITCIFPLALTSMMIPLAFLIPPETGEKMSYLVAISTSTAIFLNYISNVMPRSLSLMPYLAVLLIEVVLEGFLAILASVLVVKIYLQEKQRRVNKHQQTDRIALTENRSQHSEKVWTVKAETDSKVTKPVLQQRKYFKMTSRLLDISFFYVFTIGQVIFLLVIFGCTDWL